MLISLCPKTAQFSRDRRMRYLQQNRFNSNRKQAIFSPTLKVRKSTTPTISLYDTFNILKLKKNSKSSNLLSHKSLDKSIKKRCHIWKVPPSNSLKYSSNIHKLYKFTAFNTVFLHEEQRGYKASPLPSYTHNTHFWLFSLGVATLDTKNYIYNSRFSNNQAIFGEWKTKLRFFHP